MNEKWGIIRNYGKLVRYSCLDRFSVKDALRSRGLPSSSSAIPHAAGSAPAQHSAARADFAGMLCALTP
eukprot:354176-Pleurochrysis_carterae.AAC.1